MNKQEVPVRIASRIPSVSDERSKARPLMISITLVSLSIATRIGEASVAFDFTITGLIFILILNLGDQIKKLQGGMMTENLTTAHK
jgi:hypothetical protein